MMTSGDEEEDILDEEYLHRHNVDVEASSASFVINTVSVSLLGLHELMPNLLCLILDRSIILSLRDLGTNLTKLSTLHINDCRMSDLDGISAFPNLRELSASGNYISDISSLAMHSNIEV
jgi:Leucine-rich repeat (LRR) protein